MARTYSSMIPLGMVSPDFSLVDVISGSMKTRDDVRGENGLVVAFICSHCPFVKHVEKSLSSFADEYKDKGIGFIAISSNDVENYPDDHPDKLKEQASRIGFSFPYLYDETQQVAKLYHATCTPDFYVFDRELKCVYRGRFDESRPQTNIPVTGKDLRHAVDCILQGKKVTSVQQPSVGCSIKWKS